MEFHKHDVSDKTPTHSKPNTHTTTRLVNSIPVNKLSGKVGHSTLDFLSERSKQFKCMIFNSRIFLPLDFLNALTFWYQWQFFELIQFLILKLKVFLNCLPKCKLYINAFFSKFCISQFRDLQ